MEAFHQVQGYDHLKILADSRRLIILRRLMVKPATLSQLGQELGEHPARIRHHVKLLESAGLVEMTEVRAVRGFVEKYYRARAQAFWLQELILPDFGQSQIIPLLGSHDLALEILAEQLRRQHQGRLELVAVPVGSLDGLIALRQGLSPLASCHLWDPATGEYNLPYVHFLFPDQEVWLFTLAERQQGLMVAPGNPLRLNTLADLARPGLTLANRNRGSGTRLWLDHALQQRGLPPSEALTCASEARTHTAVAELVAQGKADVGLGLEAAARLFKLDFIPLFRERFDLAVLRANAQTQPVQAVLNLLNSAAFRQGVNTLPGYDSRHSGEQRCVGNSVS